MPKQLGTSYQHSIIISDTGLDILFQNNPNPIKDIDCSIVINAHGSTQNFSQDYSSCHEVVASLSTWGSSVKQWLHEGSVCVCIYVCTCMHLCVRARHSFPFPSTYCLSPTYPPIPAYAPLQPTPSVTQRISLTLTYRSSCTLTHTHTCSLTHSLLTTHSLTPHP